MTTPNKSTLKSGDCTLLAEALALRERGWTTIPTIGKKAACPWKRFKEQRPSPDTLRELFRGRKIDGLAVVLGSASNGLCCRDYDDLSSYDLWAKSHPELANRLPTVETHRGRHLYFRGPERFTKFADGEYRGTSGQYTVLPPSRHPAGTCYRWLIPLPDGELPTIDPKETGLCNIEDRENTADGADTAHSTPLLVSSAPTLLQSIENAIVATLPAMPGQRHRCVFRLARNLKGIPSLHSADVGTLRPIVEQWHQRALPFIGTKPFLDTWADFLPAWRRVRFPAGKGPIEAAFAQAVASAPPSTATKLYGEGPILLLATFCRELQQIVGDQEFFLDCRTAGRLIGIDHTTAWRYFDVLCADGILAAGEKGSMATHKASRFRFTNQE